MPAFRIEAGFRSSIEDAQFIGCHSCLGKDKYMPAGILSFLFGNDIVKVGVTVLVGKFPTEIRSEYIGMTGNIGASPANKFGISVLPIVRFMHHF